MSLSSLSVSLQSHKDCCRGENHQDTYDREMSNITGLRLRVVHFLLGRIYGDIQRYRTVSKVHCERMLSFSKRLEILVAECDHRTSADCGIVMISNELSTISENALEQIEAFLIVEASLNSDHQI